MQIHNITPNTLQETHTLYRVRCHHLHPDYYLKEYTGIHTFKRSVEDDDYMGSGDAIKPLVNQLGREYFRREILGVYPTREEAAAAEAERVTWPYINLPYVLNRKTGGEDENFLGGRHSEESKQLMSENTKAAMADPEVKRRHKAAMADPEVKRRHKAAMADPEVKRRQRENIKTALADPEVKRRQRENIKNAMADPEVKRRQRENNPMKRPEVVAKITGENNVMKRPEVVARASRGISKAQTGKVRAYLFDSRKTDLIPKEEFHKLKVAGKAVGIRSNQYRNMKSMGLL